MERGRDGGFSPYKNDQMKYLRIVIALVCAVGLSGCSGDSGNGALYERTPTENSDPGNRGPKGSGSQEANENSDTDDSSAEESSSGNTGSEETETDPGPNTDQAEAPPLLGELIATTPELNLFSQAVALLPETVRLALDDPETQLTLFVPTNTAIEELLTALGDDYESLLDFETPLGQQIIGDILIYHMVQGEWPPEALQYGVLLTLLSEEHLSILTSGGQWMVMDALERGAILTDTPLMASNGIIYPIEKILIPEEASRYLGL